MKKLFSSFFGDNNNDGLRSKADLLGRPFNDLVNQSGKVSYKDVLNRVSRLSEKEFVKYVGVPILVGSAVQAGVVSEQPNEEVRRKKTMAFMPTLSSSKAQVLVADALKHAIYPLIKGVRADNPDPTIFLIGRLSESDIVMPDVAVSERHAAIFFDRGAHYIKELGSTNGTKVNESEVSSQQSIQLKDGDIVTIARYEFSFLSPGSVYHRFKLTPESEVAG